MCWKLEVKFAKCDFCIDKLRNAIKYGIANFLHLRNYVFMMNPFCRIYLGAVCKRCPQSGGGGLSSANILRTRRRGWFFGYGRPHLLVQKNFGFIEIYGVPTRARGRRLSQFGHFADKGEWGQFFAILCGRLLWSAP